METGRSSFWKINLFLLVTTGLLASRNYFFLPFWYTPATTNSIFPPSGNVFLNVFPSVEGDFLTNGNFFWSIFQTFLPVLYANTRHLCQFFFSSSENVVLKQIFHSGQWKRIFRLVETILFQYLKYYFHWKRFFHLLEIYFKGILYYSLQP